MFDQQKQPQTQGSDDNWIKTRSRAQHLADTYVTPVRVYRQMVNGKPGSFQIICDGDERPAGVFIETIQPSPNATHFAQGSRQRIYQRPISQEEFEGEAVLVKCHRPYTSFDYGSAIVVEEWEVKFDGEDETYVRVVTELKGGKS